MCVETPVLSAEGQIDMDNGVSGKIVQMLLKAKLPSLGCRNIKAY